MTIPPPIRNRLSAYRRTLQVKLHLLRLSTKHVAEKQVATVLSPLSMGKHLANFLSFLLRYTLFSICNPIRPACLAAITSAEEQVSVQSHQVELSPKEVHQTANGPAVAAPHPHLLRQNQRKRSSKDLVSASKEIRHEKATNSQQGTSSLKQGAKLVEKANPISAKDSTDGTKCRRRQVKRKSQDMSSASQSTSVSESRSPAKNVSDEEVTINLINRPRPPIVLPSRPLGRVQGTFRPDGLFLPAESSLNYSPSAPFMAPNNRFVPTCPAAQQMSTMFHNLPCGSPFGMEMGFGSPASHQWPNGYATWHQNSYYASTSHQPSEEWHETSPQSNTPQTFRSPWYLNIPESSWHDSTGAAGTYSSPWQ